MAPRMGPSFEKGRSRAILWPVVVVLAAIGIYFFFVSNPEDATPTDDPTEPATASDLAEPETVTTPGAE
ncbi:hypothetical protein U0C82_04440 [Fulvimarina sp. 2208YS6-2-32]|uniref:Uncharacterized protein n=1 Tax=Fulvimarina uroteuthidis TaxID=3098149 RepID=A0ABU5HZK8_9HYPH|nr:hypothetical protein [Fulvimarina sp. 2208YS6-2-32]MDY8108401.1 hypothetical protein [Fulvimarina sp. 2208YS6-2-32]